MNLVYHISNNDLFYKVISFLLESKWLPVLPEDMSHALYFLQYHNTTDNFVCFRKQLVGNVPAHIFVYCGRRHSRTYVVLCANNSIKLRNSYGLSDFNRFHIDYRSFVIRNSKQG